ncbi:hypothetical protein B0T10DRAFT_454853 [Thelonectria olida]|uniref:Uncharacterized protein n=1 Tax=Thelonectria olida TaxID=1576542 RepID=A0A9P8WEV0_9HYPO|nr:hypothetical protein B0T10DRAFT_454853 [Thelonectria olida]
MIFFPFLVSHALLLLPFLLSVATTTFGCVCDGCCLSVCLLGLLAINYKRPYQAPPVPLLSGSLLVDAGVTTGPRPSGDLRTPSYNFRLASYATPLAWAIPALPPITVPQPCRGAGAVPQGPSIPATAALPRWPGTAPREEPQKLSPRSDSRNPLRLEKAPGGPESPCNNSIQIPFRKGLQHRPCTRSASYSQLRITQLCYFPRVPAEEVNKCWKTRLLYQVPTALSSATSAAKAQLGLLKRGTRYLIHRAVVVHAAECPPTRRPGLSTEGRRSAKLSKKPPCQQGAAYSGAASSQSYRIQDRPVPGRDRCDFCSSILDAIFESSSLINHATGV